MATHVFSKQTVGALWLSSGMKLCAMGALQKQFSWQNIKDGMSLCHYDQYPKRCILPRRKLWQTAARQWLSSTGSTWTHTPCFAGRGGTPVLIVSGEISVFFFNIKGSNFQSVLGIDMYSVFGLEGSDGICELLGYLQFIWCSTWSHKLCSVHCRLIYVSPMFLSHISLKKTYPN